MTVSNGGLAVTRAAYAAGIRVAFGIPGTHNLEIYRHLPGSGLQHVTMRHEQGMGYAADGYARVAGQPAVCFPTSGPGLSNMVAAVATAHADSVPMLIVAPGPAIGLQGGDYGNLHEMHDQYRMMSGVVASSARPTSPNEVVAAIQRLVDGMRKGRPRPAYVEVPLDVLDEPWTDSSFVTSGGITNDSLPDAPREDLVAAAESLNVANEVVIVAGGGARSCHDLVRLIAEKVKAPVVTTVNAKGVIDERHPLSMGASLRIPSARELVANADAVLMIGTEWADSDLWGGTQSLQGVVVRIDVEQEQLNKNVDATVSIQGDARQVLEALEPLLVARSGERDLATIRSTIHTEAARDGADTAWIQEAVRSLVPDGLVVCGDSAQVSYFGTVHHLPMGPEDRFLYPTGFATLGYGLPAAIGAKIADPSRDVVVVVGDGGFVFTMQELLSAVSLELPLPIIIVNNEGFKQIRDEMKDRGIEPMGVSLPSVDLRCFAEAAGATFAQAQDAHGLHECVRLALARQGPTLIDVSLSGIGS